ncbi:MAG: Lrp/AsnC ligand binding domain-containing protein [Nanoarchaeota archaeon]
MVLAYILIVAEAGREKEVAKALRKLSGVEEADTIYGEYDIIARIRVVAIENLGDFVIEKIRPIKGVKRTSTLIAVE